MLRDRVVLLIFKTPSPTGNFNTISLIWAYDMSCLAQQSIDRNGCFYVSLPHQMWTRQLLCPNGHKFNAGRNQVSNRFAALVNWCELFILEPIWCRTYRIWFFTVFPSSHYGISTRYFKLQSMHILNSETKISYRYTAFVNSSKFTHHSPFMTHTHFVLATSETRWLNENKSSRRAPQTQNERRSDNRPNARKQLCIAAVLNWKITVIHS